MSSLEQWRERWEDLADTMEKDKFLRDIPEELENEPEVKSVYSWWKARYYYPDKNKTRVGDRMVWLILTLRGQEKNRAGQKEFMRVYKTALESEEAKEALETNPNELENQLYSAALLYAGTIGEPSAILGLIPQKDKTETDKFKRVAKLIIENHIGTLWALRDKLVFAPEITTALLKATKTGYPGIDGELRKAADVLKDNEFKQWMAKFVI